MFMFVARSTLFRWSSPQTSHRRLRGTRDRVGLHTDWQRGPKRHSRSAPKLRGDCRASAQRQAVRRARFRHASTRGRPRSGLEVPGQLASNRRRHLRGKRWRHRVSQEAMRTRALLQKIRRLRPTLPACARMHPRARRERPRMERRPREMYSWLPCRKKAERVRHPATGALLSTQVGVDRPSV